MSETINESEYFLGGAPSFRNFRSKKYLKIISDFNNDPGLWRQVTHSENEEAVAALDLGDVGVNNGPVIQYGPYDFYDFWSARGSKKSTIRKTNKLLLKREEKEKKQKRK